MATDLATRAAIDDVFDDNFSDFGDDPFADKPARDLRDKEATLSSRSSLKRKAGDDDKENFGLGLGLDEEVKIVKKRKPIAKLDEARLLSEPGIPVLRTLIREKQISRKLRLKGKGHEFTDAARLLNYFQLWLDNLYPRAKFADALQLVEKVGHTKRMQLMRNEWINESKPGYIRPELVRIDTEIRDDEMPDLFANATNSTSSIPAQVIQGQPETTNRSSMFDNGLRDDSLFIPDADDEMLPNDDRPDNDGDKDDDSDDDLEAILAMQEDFQPRREPRSVPPRIEEPEGEDDLDAILAEQEFSSKATFPQGSHILAMNENSERHDEDDDLDALLAEQEAFLVEEKKPREDLGRDESSASPIQTINVDKEDSTAARSTSIVDENSRTIDVASQQRNEEQAKKEVQLISEGNEVDDNEDSQLRGVEERATSSSPMMDE